MKKRSKKTKRIHTRKKKVSKKGRKIKIKKRKKISSRIHKKKILRKIKKRKIKTKFKPSLRNINKIKIPQFKETRKELKKLTFQKVLNFLLDPIFRAYETFREKRKIEKLKKIALEKKKKKEK